MEPKSQSSQNISTQQKSKDEKAAAEISGTANHSNVSEISSATQENSSSTHKSPKTKVNETVKVNQRKNLSAAFLGIANPSGNSQECAELSPGLFTPTKKRSFHVLSPTEDNELSNKMKRSSVNGNATEISYRTSDDAFDDSPISSSLSLEDNMRSQTHTISEENMESVNDIDADYIDDQTANHLGKKFFKNKGQVKMVPINAPSHYGSRLAKQQFNQTSRNRIQKPNQKRQHVQYPVILEETEQGVPYDSLAPHHLNLWKSKGIIIKTQYRLRKGKWLISCENPNAQKNAATSTHLSGATFKCHIPKNTTKGVIGPFNMNINIEEVKKSMQKEKKVSDIQRIYKGQTPTAMLKVFFESETLPKEVRVGAEIFVVQPFRRTVIRCSHCQALGHKKLECQAKMPTCAGCGSAPHDKDPKINSMMCNKKKCINCGGPHSAAYKGCPEVYLHTKASEINSLFGISEFDAMSVLRTMTQEKLKQDVRKFQRNEFVTKKREQTPSNAYYQQTPPTQTPANLDQPDGIWSDHISQSQSFPALAAARSDSDQMLMHQTDSSQQNSLSQISTVSNVEAKDAVPSRHILNKSTQGQIQKSDPEPKIEDLFHMIIALQKQVDTIDQRTKPAETQTMKKVNATKACTSESPEVEKDKTLKSGQPQNISLQDISNMVSELSKKIQTLDKRTQSPTNTTYQTV